MCNSIARAIFNRVYLKILNFELQNLSSSTFFEQSTSYFADISFGQFKENG
jgi:hypothetical protein